MGGGSKKQTVGYKYYLGMHAIACHGPVDALRAIRFDNKVAWEGNHFGEEVSGPIVINKPELFGGQAREGGVGGRIYFETGKKTQGVNSYLASKLGGLIPAFRGVAGLVFKGAGFSASRGFYFGNNPYLKKFSFRLKRVHVRQDGIEQWYDAKSEISASVDLEVGAEWKYKVIELSDPTDYSDPDYDDSSWSVGTAPFMDSNGPNTQAPPPFLLVPGTVVPINKTVWLRKQFNFTATSVENASLELFVDDHYFVYFNGVLIGSGGNNSPSGSPEDFHFTADIPPELINYGINTVALQARDEIVTPGGRIYADLRLNAASNGDMNPAHIIRECLTDPDWGMGYNEADIDDDSFMAAADKLYLEGMGISLLWDQQFQIEAFIQEIVKHISASCYVDRKTGKFVLKLVRDDYDADDLIHLTEDDIDKVEDFKRPQFGELTTSVSVGYWDSTTNTKASVTIQDIALEQMQQASINTTMQYPGFTNKSIATRIAQRDLRVLSSALASCTVYTNRKAKDLQIGDVFRMTWPDYNLNESVMRVTGIAYGDGKNNRIRLSCAEDVFSLDDVAIIPPTPPIWVDPNGPPTPVVSRLPMEVPYLELVQQLTQATIDSQLTTNPDAGYVGMAAKRPQENAINARMYTNPGSGFTLVGLVDFCPTAKLTAAIDRLSTTFAIKEGDTLSNVTLGSWVQCQGEMMAVVLLTTDSIEVERGCLDTVPAEHPADALLFFWDAFPAGDETEYTGGETIGVKLATFTGSDELDLADADTDNVTLGSRAIRPYPPGNLKFNGEYFPTLLEGDIAITWAHRDRLQQTGGELVGFQEGDIGPEAGTTYTIKIYGDDVLVRTEDGISGTSFTYEAADEEGDGGPFLELRFEVYSVRDGFDSYQLHDVTIVRPQPVEAEGIFIPEETLDQPLTLLWNNDSFIVSIAGTVNGYPAIGVYKIADDLTGDPEYLGMTYDARFTGPSQDYIPESYFMTIRRTFQDLLPIDAGGIDEAFALFWRRQNGGITAPDGRWMLLADEAVPSFSIVDTGVSPNADIIGMVKLANGDLFALASGAPSAPAKAYKSVNNGKTWSSLGNVTGIGSPGDGSGYLVSGRIYELADGTLWFQGVKSTDGGLTWTASVPVLGSNFSYSIADVAYDGTALAAVIQAIPPLAYKTEVEADSPVCWLRFGDEFGSPGLLREYITGNVYTRFSPTPGVLGAGISQSTGCVAKSNAANVGSYGVTNSVLTYMEPRTVSNGVVNHISGTDDFTVEFWIEYFSVAPNASDILTLFSQNKLLTTTGVFAQIQLTYRRDTDTYALVIRDNQSNEATFGSIVTNISGTGPELFDSNPHHVVIRRGASGRAAIIVDNNVVASQSSGTVANVTSGSLAAGTVWGNLFNGNTTYFYSKLDECAIYNSELSDARVAAHYNAGLDDGKYKNIISRTIDNGVTWTYERNVLAEDDIAPGYAYDLVWKNIVPWNGGFAVYGYNPFSGSFPHVLLSTNHGDTWAAAERVHTPDYTSDLTGNSPPLNMVAHSGLILATTPTKVVTGNPNYPQFSQSDDAVNFTALPLTFPIGAAGVDIFAPEDREDILITEGGDAHVPE